MTAAFEGLHVKPKAGRTLIVGSRIYLNKPDRRKLYPNAVGVDLTDGPGVDLVADLEYEQVGRFAHIECMSVLEHCKRPWVLAENLVRMLEKDGTIFVAVPFVWKYHGYPDDYWRFTTDGVRLLFPRINWLAEAYSYHDKLCSPQDIPAVRDNDWPHMACVQACLFGSK